MRNEKRALRLSASVAVLMLALHPGVWAQEPAEAATETAPTPAPAAETAPAIPEAAPIPAIPEAAAPEAEATPVRPNLAAEAAARRAERQAERMEQRRQRYEELRARAAEAGLDLPETPPWEAKAPAIPPPPPPMPERPAVPAPPAAPGLAAGGGEAFPETPPWISMSPEEFQAHREKMRRLSPEERAALREQHWAQMRERAGEQGLERPETPPWSRFQQHREERFRQWEDYRRLVEQMTPEQREAAAAIFGAPSHPPCPMSGRPQQGWAEDAPPPFQPYPGAGARPYPGEHRGGYAPPWPGADETWRPSMPWPPASHSGW